VVSAMYIYILDEEEISYWMFVAEKKFPLLQGIGAVVVSLMIGSSKTRGGMWLFKSHRSEHASSFTTRRSGEVVEQQYRSIA
jgi:hypothetical protein